MRKTNNRSAFTLVELIVVITILAILGTIGFMSIKGYTKEAGNATVVEELDTLSRGINLKVAEGGWLMAFVTTGTSKLDTLPSLSGIAATATNYDAGTPNYTALSVKADEFRDPNGNDYRIGATTTAGGRMEMAGVVNIDGENQAVVKGTYIGRTIADTTITDLASVSGKVITLNAIDTNTFSTNDTVTLTDSVDAANNVDVVIKKVARDGVTLTFSSNVASSFDWIQLKADETTGLIESRDTADQVVVNGSGSTLPY